MARRRVRVGEDGRHETLLQQGGRYGAMFNAQADAYQTEQQESNTVFVWQARYALEADGQLSFIM